MGAENSKKDICPIKDQHGRRIRTNELQAMYRKPKIVTTIQED
jgi:hypothetical protein